MLQGAILVAALATGDPQVGEAVYSRCLGCHSFEVNRTGPKHCGVFGRRAGSVPGFGYSSAMKRSTIVWNEQTLERFLADPLKTIPGTAMTYAGVPGAKDRADLISYLRQRSSKCD